MGSPLLQFPTIPDALFTLDGLGLLQRITGLSVDAGPESVRIRFNTVLETSALQNRRP